MRVTIISTSDNRGGAAICATRVYKAMRACYPEINMLVRDKLSSETEIQSLDWNFIQRSMNFLWFILERLHYAIYMRSRALLFFFSPGFTGRPVRRYPVVRKAEFINLHWINQGFLSHRELERLGKSGKKIVWTLHDMWAFTGGCHYSGECNRFTVSCGNCPFLRKPAAKDFSHRIFKRKSKVYSKADICFVTSSDWLAEKARSSGLIGSKRILTIPTPLDINIYKPSNRDMVRKQTDLPLDKFLILFGSANINDQRKGFKYLLEALGQLYEHHPELRDKTGLVTFGKQTSIESVPFPVYDNGYVKDETDIARFYQSADIFILPSLEDNLPNTVMESLACGTPVVAFKTGGIPEMISHEKTGYLAAYKDSSDLYKGILWALLLADNQKIRSDCRQKVLNDYAPEVVASKYYELYKSL